jgi:hypothetical protein
MAGGGMTRLQQTPVDILSRLLEPVGEMMPVSFAKQLAGMQADPEIQARIDELADRANDGVLTAEERAEYEAYIDAIDVISILQAKARAVLASQPND